MNITVFFAISIVFYIVVVIRLTRRWVSRIILKMESEVLLSQRKMEGFVEKKKKIFRCKKNIEDEAFEMFTLYEMTKDITKSLNEEEAFIIFKKKLREHIAFEHCQFFDAMSKEVKSIEKAGDSFVFMLKEKRKRIGYLVVDGLVQKDKDKFMILAHQFALALRRVQLYREIEQIAITDSLTGVYTRLHIMERLSEELGRSKIRKIKMSFLMIDVDFFKRFNDEYGHLTGDQILREVGSIIRKNIREIDVAGRYGGEEFCVVLPDTDKEGAHYAAERIRLAMEEAIIKAYDMSIKATLSIGTATFPEDAKKMDEMVDKADWALYRAKKQGRNRVCLFGLYED
ncbi:hypothetical protein MNBD_UNCLBAC01-1831 [hydrothermal vent metagenome]|uniref:GGDEF domain-containing protein n=1 Tax=hydrothermal vent metagenome TaxID=652676 RepID=A0A3B1DJJ0_9ZZZZ